MTWYDLGIELLDSSDVGELNTIEAEHHQISINVVLKCLIYG